MKMSLRSPKSVYIENSRALFFSFARRRRIEAFFTQIVEFEAYLCAQNWVKLKKSKGKSQISVSLTTQLSKSTDISLIKVVDFFFFCFLSKTRDFFFESKFMSDFFFL